MTEEDDDLDELWAELRPAQPPRPKPEPPPPPLPFGGMPFPRRVYIGLLRDNGYEVDAPTYARVTTLLKLQDAASGSLTYDVISFPKAAEDWGTVVTLGFFQDDGEALFYTDLRQPLPILKGDTLTIRSPSEGLQTDGVRPPT